MPASLVELALAVSASPVSLDSLVDWSLARPSEVFAWFERARARDLVRDDGRSGHRLIAIDDDLRAVVLARATYSDFQELARHRDLVPELLGAARRASAAGRTRMATDIHRAVFEATTPDSFPGGPAAFVAAVVETIPLYRGLYGVMGDALDRAIDTATSQGDLASQALLLAARGVATLRGHLSGDGAALLARAREAAEAVGGAVQVEVTVYTAVSLVFAGRLREGVAVFEELLGDVPGDLLAPENRALVVPESATPAAALCILSTAYSAIGHHARAVNILHRLLELGERIGRPALVAEARLFLARVYALRGEIDSARPHAEAAFEAFGSCESEPLYAYFAGLALAAVRVQEGRFADASAAFDSAVVGLQRSGAPLAGWLPYDVAAQLVAAGHPLPKGLDLVAEATRATTLPLAHAAGLGHLFLGSREADPEAALRHAGKAVELLRDSGAIRDLERTLVESAAIAERTGHADVAQRWSAEAAAICASGPSPASAPQPDNAARLRSIVLDLGRLPISARHDGFWGAIASRLCQRLSAERCALVELTPAPRVLCARGGGKEWADEVVAGAPSTLDGPLVRRRGDGRGQVALVPFSAPDLGRKGYLVLENGHTPPAITEGDRELLEALGVQVGVLFGNAVLWQELSRARERLEQENRYFREDGAAAPAGARLVAHSKPMREVMSLVARVAPANVAVLVYGETGVGKELIAREVHHQSARQSGPFIAVHIASLAPGLVASGLFGHERGAFTGATEQARGRFELADGGTLLLDEIGELSLEHQVKLLRVLQEGTFERVGGARALRSDFRLVAATNRDLRAEVRAGRFREDLYFRLSTFPIRVPPLRERRDEIPTLALHFMERVCRQRGVRFEGIGEADMERLVAWDWPGNVRELEHVIERAALLSEPPRLRVPPLEGGLERADGHADPRPASAQAWVTLDEAERRYLRDVLAHARGRISGPGGAADILGLKPSTLNFRIRKLGLVEEVARARKQAAGPPSAPSPR